MLALDPGVRREGQEAFTPRGQWGRLRVQFMQHTILNVLRFATVGAAALFGGCASDSEAQVNKKTGASSATAVATATATNVTVTVGPGTNVSVTPNSAELTNAVIGGTNSAAGAQVTIVSAPVRPPDLKVSEGVESVIKMAESGVDEVVLLAYVNNSQKNFDVDADEVLYLNDLGIPSTVIAAMIQQNASGAVAMQSKTPGGVPVPAQPTVAAFPVAAPAVPAGTQAPVAAEAQTATATAPTEQPAPVAAPAPPPPTEVVYAAPTPETQVTYNYFYSSLAPYGSWIEVPSYGLCWQPTVSVVSPGWRPYWDRGHWVYSDCGWYWHSDYSWGWGPFHYGRWHRPSGFGWVWLPDTTWGPSWVTWRHTDSYYGWAPLPPSARFHSGVGFTYFDSHVGVSFGFGLGYDAFGFVPRAHFYDRNPRAHAVHSSQVAAIYGRSTVINNYVTGNNNTIINEGPGRDRIASATRQEIRKVSIREMPSSRDGRVVRPDRLERVGDREVIYRPAPHPVSTQAADVARAQQEAKKSPFSAPPSTGGRPPVTASPRVALTPASSAASPWSAPAGARSYGSDRPVPRDATGRANPAAGSAPRRDEASRGTFNNTPPALSPAQSIVNNSQPVRSGALPEARRVTTVPSTRTETARPSGTQDGSRPVNTIPRSQPQNLIVNPVSPNTGVAARSEPMVRPPVNAQPNQPVRRVEPARNPVLNQPAVVAPRADASPYQQPQIIQPRPASPYSAPGQYAAPTRPPQNPAARPEPVPRFSPPQTQPAPVESFRAPPVGRQEFSRPQPGNPGPVMTVPTRPQQNYAAPPPAASRPTPAPPPAVAPSPARSTPPPAQNNNSQPARSNSRDDSRRP